LPGTAVLALDLLAASTGSCTKTLLASAGDGAAGLRSEAELPLHLLGAVGLADSDVRFLSGDVCNFCDAYYEGCLDDCVGNQLCRFYCRNNLEECYYCCSGAC
jgi:hypothetical protein